MLTIASVTALVCAFVASRASLGIRSSVATSSSTVASSASSSTTRLRKPAACASSGPNSRHVITSSLVSAGPISRTSRGMPPHASGMPSSTSGIEKRADRAATRRSHTAARTSPPPTHQPWTLATVTARSSSIARAIRHPVSASSRGERAPASPLPNEEMSAPAENARPRPDTTTTFSSSWPSNHRAAASISPSVCVDSGFSLSGRFSTSSPRAPSTATSMVSNCMAGDRTRAVLTTVPAMLGAYRVIDATDHRGQLAGMILAGLGAEVILAEPPGGGPHRTRGDGLEFWAYNRGKQSVVCATDDEVLDLVRDADVLLDSGGRFDPADVARINPAAVHVTITAFGRGGPKADWAASDLTILAAGCSQALNGDSDRPPVRTAVPQAWLHAGAEAAVGALLALTERATSGRGQHVDVSAQQAVLQAAIPGVLMTPNDNPELHRTSGGILLGPLHLQFVYPASDGYVSITLLFGSMIGPFSARLMQWVCDEGHCSTEMRDWDWDAFGLRLLTDARGRRRAGGRQGGDHGDDQLAHQGRALRRGVAPAGAAGAGDDGARAGRHGAPQRPRLLGGGGRPGLPRSVRALVGVAAADARPAAGGGRARRR